MEIYLNKQEESPGYHVPSPASRLISVNAVQKRVEGHGVCLGRWGMMQGQPYYVRAWLSSASVPFQAQKNARAHT